MEKQLKQRILNVRLSDISLADSIEVTPSSPIHTPPPPHSFNQIKKFLLIVMTLTFIVYRMAFAGASFDCMVDRSHQMTQYFNTLANQSPLFYNIISIVSQEAIEIEIIVMLAVAIMRLQNMRIHMFVAVFYGVRAIHLQLVKLPFPEGIVSYPPIFPCFSVPYGITRDFYYSGHTGLMLFSALLWRRLGYRALELLTYPFLGIVVVVLLITRVHYIIDVVGGAIFTLWIDRFLLSRVICFDYAFTCIYRGIVQAFKSLRAAIN